jgi:hypothetical protein
MSALHGSAHFLTALPVSLRVRGGEQPSGVFENHSAPCESTCTNLMREIDGVGRKRDLTLPMLRVQHQFINVPQYV